MVPNLRSPLPITWTRWLGVQAPTADLLTRYVKTVVQPTSNRLKQIATIERGDPALVAWTAFTNHWQAQQGVLAVNTAGLLDQAATDLADTVHRIQHERAPYEKVQSEHSLLGAKVNPGTATDLLLASTNGVRGWQDDWATRPIPVDINHKSVPAEVSALVAFILSTDDVVGIVYGADERDRQPPPQQGAEQVYAAAMVVETRTIGARERSVGTKNYGVMRSWHMDVNDWISPHRGAGIASDRAAKYLAANQDEFANGYGIEAAADVRNRKKVDRTLVENKKLVPQGMTEFNVRFDTNGRLVFDYGTGDFYLTGHYAQYEVPGGALADGDKPNGRECWPYFKLLNADQVTLTTEGHMEVGRLRYWENLRRQGYGRTLG
ncbi:hypothetical protein ACGFNU_38125 [Spirillospora sp. NPDC048911]|uniref:hypothetical protein n=1 Tax=Spirillospora sp. NPDC048911 TaxID=3364527 RepID=UPI003711989E